MRKTIKTKFKEGAASFYIVAFSTLILVIVAMSFAAIIVSEVTRTTNDDLSQSAYDSALAGVEDAKVAIFNYRNCVENNLETAECTKLKETMKAVPTCTMVGEMLGRTVDAADGSVKVTEGGNNNMMQAYTCVKIVNSLSDYRATLSESNQTRVVRVRVDQDQKQGSDENASISASDIKKVRISWYSDSDSDKDALNYTNSTSGEVLFKSLSNTKASTPPTLMVQMVQTAGTFRLEDFVASVGNTTNRGTVYLVPTKNSTQAAKDTAKHKGAWSAAKKQNVIPKEAMVKSNDKTVTNLPYEVYCKGGNKETEDDGGHEFACAADIILPDPVAVGDSTTRSDETFMFVVSIPYGKPSTDFALEFFCSEDDNVGCARKLTEDDAEVTTSDNLTSRVNLKDVQIAIDSTGRANDLYRRIETRLESSDTSFAFPLYAIQLLDDGTSAGSYALEKDLTVTEEYNFNN